MYKDFKDYYRILGIAFSASDAEIKAAYRKMARIYHPDMHPEETERYTSLFQEVTEAYETLSDAAAKVTYDFRYRQRVLGEGPQYEYYTDEVPEDTTSYQHKYTRWSRDNINAIRILIVGLLLFQLYRSLSQASEVKPEARWQSPVSTPDLTPNNDINSLMRHSSSNTAPAARDSVSPLPGSPVVDRP